MRSSFKSRRSTSPRTLLIILAVVVTGLAGAMVWLSGEPERRAPAPTEQRIEVTNVL